MYTFFKLVLPLLATLSLDAATAPTAGEIETTEALLTFRISRSIVWQDPQTGQALQRRNHHNELVPAAIDSDITPDLANSGIIIGDYLINQNNIPAATNRSAALLSLVNDPNYNQLFTLVSNYRTSIGNIMRDCFGREIYKAILDGSVTVANTSDILDVASLLAVVRHVMLSRVTVIVPRPAVTLGEIATAQALLNFRVSRDVVWLNPRTQQPLYRLVNNNPVKAARDDDITPNLSNAGVVMAGYLTNQAAVVATSVPATLMAIFNDVNLNDLYTRLENIRRMQNYWMIDCLGQPIYDSVHATRVQVVDMQDVINLPTLLGAFEAYFLQS